ncbi:hypothetical protein C0995_013884 [Termitomyces sp. Mi166|nr:hypothetical protein C0995_013884 [Termitomyces sp. Mi166\
MAFQSPMISIPKKSTDEVDWTTPIRTLIAQSYGENPDNYASECAQLQRCRQDAVRGAGSDFTARDLLYKYFGQLELLELRFPEIKVTFPWHDAFTGKLTTQTSIAYEKASTIFQIAATHSSIAAAQSRSDPEGTKRAFYYFRSCAGMLTYINDNFLHAPSTDLSSDVVKFLADLILAQATEVFFEKCVDEKKGNALVAKVAAQAATMYTTLSEELKEFVGKGIFDRNWAILIQIKSKHFVSLSQYHRALADTASSNHGDALARLALSTTLSKDAHRLSVSFSASSPTLPADAASSLVGLTKTLSSLTSTALSTATKENDLIYHASIPAPESLPKIDGISVASPVPIHEVYASPEVQRVIGQELFRGLVPMAVHESASVYSEEKAKVVRKEVEGVERARAEVESVLEGVGVNKGLGRYRALALGRRSSEGRGEDGEEGGGDVIPAEVRRAAEELAQLESEPEGPVSSMLSTLHMLQERVSADLDALARALDAENRECEEMRVKWGHKWTQEPAGGVAAWKGARGEVRSHVGALEVAGRSDEMVRGVWGEVKGDVGVLLGTEGRGLEEVFGEAERGEGGKEGRKEESLLDLEDVGKEEEEEQELRAKIGGFVAEIEERMSRLDKLARERGQVLGELKEKIQMDDVSHLLLVNRRNTGIEPALFASELEKFKPYTLRLAALQPTQDLLLTDIRSLYASLRSLSSSSSSTNTRYAKIIRRWDTQDRRKKELVKRFVSAKEGYVQVREGLKKGLGFYRELEGIVRRLEGEVRGLVRKRRDERGALVGNMEREEREKPVMAPKPSGSAGGMGLEPGFKAMSIGRSQEGYAAPSPPLPPRPPVPAQSPQQYNYSLGSGSGSLPPPPPQPQYRSPPSLPPSQPQHQQQQYTHQQVYPPPPVPVQTHQPQPPQQQQPSSTGLTGSTFLPPPPPRPAPTQATFSPAPSFPPTPSALPPAPMNDPYATLGMFEGPQASSAPSTAPSSNPTYVSQQPQSGYRAYQPPNQPQQAEYRYAQVQGGFLPPPLPPPGQQQQQQYGQGQGQGQQGYGYGYGGYGR